MPRSSSLTPVTVGLLLGAASGVLAALLGATAVVRGFELKLHDVAAQAFAEPEKGRTSKVKVAILTDEDLRFWRNEGFAELGSYPPPRQLWADLVEAIAARRPAAIVLDLLFLDPSSAGTGVEDDRALAAAMARTASLVLAASAEGAAAPGAGAVPPENARIAAYGARELLPAPGSLLLPIEPLASAALRIGLATVRTDDVDGVMRRMPMAFRFGDAVVPSLPTAAVMAAFGESSLEVAQDGRQLKRFAGIDLRLDGRANLLLNYRGPAGTFPTTNLRDLGQALFDPDKKLDWLEAIAAGDVVVLGANVAGNPDAHTAPTAEKMPGPEVVATAIDNLIRGDPRGRPPRAMLRFLAVLVGALVGASSMLSSRRRMALLLALPILLAYVTAALFLFRGGLVLDLVTPVGAGFLAYLAAAIWLFQTEGKKRRQIRAMFSRCLSPDVVSELEEHPESLTLGGQRQVLSVFFSDIAGFTSISERMKPEELVAFLNQYLTFMTNTIMDTRGLIDKYQGDAVMAFWGAPLPLADHAQRALAAAARCVAELEKFSAAKAAQGLPQLATRIGINTGPLVVGYMGSERRLEYTVIGDTVNLASRLEGANKYFHSTIMISQATLDAAGPGAAVTRPLGNLRVKGKEQPVRVHELLGAGGAGCAALPDWAALYVEAHALFEQGEFTQALERFAAADRARPGGDPVARRFLEITADHAKIERQGPFDGVITLTEK